MEVVKSRPLLRYIIVYFLLLIWCDCLQVQLASSDMDQGAENKEVRVSIVKLLPRKLRALTEKVTITVLDNAEKSYSPDPDNLEQKNAPAAAAKPHFEQGQRWQQWMDEGKDSSEFFTMDYSRVRRRRPIHNKSLPVGP